MRDTVNDQQVRVIKDETGTRVVMLDKNGLRTTQPGAGIDVFTASESEYTFNSANNVFKIVGSGLLTLDTVNITTGASSYGNNVVNAVAAHNLGYTPAIIAYYENVGSYGLLPFLQFGPVSASAFAQWSFRASVDETNVYFILDWFAYNLPGGTSHPETAMKYYLLQETAN